MKTGRKQDENRMKTGRKQDGNRTETGRKQDEYWYLNMLTNKIN
jgi:hypothetical protein